MESSGAFLIDKPTGLTSAAVVGMLKRRFGLHKVGHAGTLDPLATGLLVVLFNSATRLQALFLEGDKSYEGVIRLGLCTDTDDSLGREIACVHEDDPRLDQIEAQLPLLRERFTGVIEQVPPQYSAIKVQGRRSYELARKDQPVALKPRLVEIKRLELTLLSRGFIGYSLCCSKGTYVRSLARDIGNTLGIGGSLAAIRRTRSGQFSVADALPLETVIQGSCESFSRPIESLVNELPRVELNAVQERLFLSGHTGAFSGVRCSSAVQREQPWQFAVFGQTGRLLGLAEAKEGKLLCSAVFAQGDVHQRLSIA